MPNNIARYHAPREFGSAGHAWLLDAIEASLAAGTVTVQLDVGDVELLDSYGLGALVAAERRLRGQGGVLLLADPSPDVVRGLSAIGLYERLVIRVHEAEADHDSVVAAPDVDDVGSPVGRLNAPGGGYAGEARDETRVLARGDLEALDRVVSGAETGGRAPDVVDVVRASAALDRVRGDRPFW